MNKYAMFSLASMLMLGIGTVNAQDLAAAPNKTRAANGIIGRPPPPPILEACMSMPDGTIECEQTICQNVGSNLNECITYTFKRDSYDP